MEKVALVITTKKASNGTFLVFSCKERSASIKVSPSTAKRIDRFNLGTQKYEFDVEVVERSVKRTAVELLLTPSKLSRTFSSKFICKEKEEMVDKSFVLIVSLLVAIKNKLPIYIDKESWQEIAI